MALSQAKLAPIFAGVESTEAGAIDVMALAFVDFFSDATVAGAPALVSALSGPGSPAALMRAALAGLSQPGAGAAKLQAGITAFWTQAMLVAPTIWPTAAPPIVPASGIIPTGLGAITGSLVPVFGVNTATKADRATAGAALALALFPHRLGATVLLAPGTNPPVPVL